MTADMQTVLLTTVNAPYQNHLDVSGLAAALMDGNVALGQVSSFFTETTVDLQKDFADQQGISLDILMQVAGAFKDWSGQDVALVA